MVGRLATGQARSGKQPQPGADNQARPQTNWAPPPALTPPPSIATGALSAYELAERRKSGFAKEELAWASSARSALRASAPKPTPARARKSRRDVERVKCGLVGIEELIGIEQDMTEISKGGLLGAGLLLGAV